MKRNFFSFSFVLVMVVGVSFLSCSKQVTSKPNFIFKPAPRDGVAFKVKGEEISEAELYKGVEGELYEAELKVYEIKMNKLRAVVLEKFMTADPRKKGISNDEFLEKYIAKSIKVTKNQVEKFIKKRGIPDQHINDQMRDRIKKFLIIEGKKEAVEVWIAGETKKNPVEVYIKRPTRPVFEVPQGDSPFWGNSDAKVTIVEYSDFQCPFCAKGKEIVDGLKKKYGKKIKVVFKNFPLPFHNNAKTAAVASLCANEQGSKYFWKMHDHMFENQTLLDRKELKKAAKKLGLKTAKFNECLEKEKYLATVNKEMDEGRNIGVKSTPTFYVNGQLVNGAHPLEVFSEIIDEELSK